MYYPMKILPMTIFDSFEALSMKMADQINIILAVACPNMTSLMPLMMTMKVYLKNRNTNF